MLLTLDEARPGVNLHCEVASCKSNLPEIKTPIFSLFSIGIKSAHLHGGRLQLFRDGKKGTTALDIDVCNPDLQVTVTAKGALSFRFKSTDHFLELQLGKQPALLESVPAAVFTAEAEKWLQIIEFLQEVHRKGRGMYRMACTKEGTSLVTALETVGETTWSLSEKGVFMLTEWTLRAEHHGLSRTDRLEPARVVQIALNDVLPRAWGISRFVWVASDVIWVGAGHRICNVLLSSERGKEVTLLWPDNEEAGNETVGHERRIQLMTVVKSSSSPSDHEVWTYASDEPHVLVWQTPRFDHQTCQVTVDDCIKPKLIARLPLPSTDPSNPIKLTCIKQVNADQVWAGTYKGNLIGWDITGHQLLQPQPVSGSLLHPEGGITSLATTADLTDRQAGDNYFVLSASYESCVRKINVIVERQ